MSYDILILARDDAVGTALAEYLAREEDFIPHLSPSPCPHTPPTPPAIILADITRLGDITIAAERLTLVMGEANTSSETGPNIGPETYDAYIPYPICLMRMTETICHLLRRTAENRLLPFGTLVLDRATRTVSDTRTPSHMPLTHKECAIIDYLHDAGGAVVSKDALLQGVWGYHPDMTTHTLETHIYSLRRKFTDVLNGDRAVAEKILKTVDGGYRLAPPIL